MTGKEQKQKMIENFENQKKKNLRKKILKNFAPQKRKRIFQILLLFLSLFCLKFEKNSTQQKEQKKKHERTLKIKEIEILKDFEFQEV